MQDQKEYIQLSYPIASQRNRELKVLASARGKTLKQIFSELIDEYINRPENQKILVNIR